MRATNADVQVRIHPVLTAIGLGEGDVEDLAVKTAGRRVPDAADREVRIRREKVEEAVERGGELRGRRAGARARRDARCDDRDGIGAARVESGQRTAGREQVEVPRGRLAIE